MALNKNLLIGILALTTLGSAVWAWQEHARLSALEEQFAQSTASLSASWEKRLAALAKSSTELETELTASKQRAEADRKERLARGDDRNWSDRGGPGGRMGQYFAMMDDPKFAKLMATEQRGQLDGRYAALFKNLKLSPADLEKFKGLLVEKQSSMREVMSAARAQGLDPRTDRAAVQQLVAQANAELDANIQSTLGVTGFAQYQQYEQTMPERNVVSQLDQRLSYSTTPLNPEQQEQLVQLLAQTAPPSENTNPGRGGPGGPRFNVTDQAIAQASAVLTPDQVVALQQIQQEQQAQRQIFQQMRQQQQPGGGGQSTAAPAPVIRSTAPVATAPTG